MALQFIVNDDQGDTLTKQLALLLTSSTLIKCIALPREQFASGTSHYYHFE